MTAIRDAKITLGVDPLGGAGIDYWPRIAEEYGLDITIVNNSVDPTFRFMTVDSDTCVSEQSHDKLRTIRNGQGAVSFSLITLSRRRLVCQPHQRGRFLEEAPQSME